MKTLTRLSTLIAVVASLSGCAGTPPVPADQMTDAQLCAEYGYAQASGNVNRVAEVVAEGNRRTTAGPGAIDDATCQTLAQTGANRVQQEQIENARQQAAWAQVAAYGQQMQAQQQAESYQQQQIANQQMQALNQQMQAQQQQQSLNNIANAIRGY
ncbi:hypothetical protein [Hafnia alvei]|uniref:hypothetical protein n=1 Tax=Hafnia alvei TaxID=569 RepID=UPI00061D3519|nr:hypothetical protein [Hafnia alvei]KKF38435.1 hypothetical protein PU01_23120 [Hafnia alvei]MBW3476483.1 hypothetical protein [Hafnia alvei]